MESAKAGDEGSKLIVIDLRNAALAARWFVVARWRILDAKEVVQDVPDVSRLIVWLPTADVQDHCEEAAADGRRFRLLSRECEPISVPEVKAADDWC